MRPGVSRFLRAVGVVLLRGLTAAGALCAYAVVLLLLAVVGGPFAQGFTVFNYLVLAGAAVWTLMPLFRYVLESLFGDSVGEDRGE